MKAGGFVYRVEMELEITREEHTHLMELSKSHYDFKCRSISSPGAGSFLYGWQWLFEVKDDKEMAQVYVTWNQLDTLCKITESPETNPDIAWTLRQLFAKLRAESERVNKAI